MPWPAGSPNSACRSAIPPGQDQQALGPAIRDGRDERGQLADRTPFIGRRWVGGADEDRVGPSIEELLRHLERIGRLGARRDRPPAAAGGRGDERGERPFRGRDDPERAGRVRADLEADEIRRGHAGQPEALDDARVWPGSRRSRRISRAVSGPSTLGSAIEPIRRQARPSLPTMDTETVAAPTSTAAKARGSLVTEACYPPSTLGEREADGRSVRRPRSSRRRSPRAA